MVLMATSSTENFIRNRKSPFLFYLFIVLVSISILLLTANCYTYLQTPLSKPHPTPTPNLECRMYESKLPEVDDTVMIQVKNIAESSVCVSLLEYNNIEGIISFVQLSRSIFKNASAFMKVGGQEPVIVTRVDKEKGYIDLSRRIVSDEDIAACEIRYNKSKIVHSIMRHVAETMSIDLEDLYINIGWPLYRKYGHAFEAFRLIVNDADSILDPLITREIEEEVGPDGQEVTKVVPAVPVDVKTVLLTNIRASMTLEADLEED